MRFRLPYYVGVMTLVTAGYLTIEIPFSVHLVQVMGGLPSQADIDSIERFGRVLTGVAVSIWIIGALVLPRMYWNGHPVATSLIVALAVSVAATWGTYEALQRIADATGDYSSPEARKEAYLSTMAKRHIAEHGTGDLPVADGSDWHAFISVVPVLSSAESLLAAAGKPVDELARADAQRMIGTEKAVREHFFGTPFDRVRLGYLDYKEGSEGYLSQRAQVREDALGAWNDYRNELRRNFGNRTRYGSDTRRIVIKKLRERGINVPNSWQLHDRSGFIAAYTSSAMARIDEAYRSSVERAAGGFVPPGLDFEGFQKHATVQKQMRSSSGLPSKGGTIAFDMSDAAFRKEVYLPQLEALTADMVAAAGAPASEFADGGPYASFGIDAVRAARLPTLAILLSIAGAMLHIFKFSGYVSQIFGHLAGMRGLARGWHRHAFGAAITASFFLFMGISGNTVTPASAYAELKDGNPTALVLEGAIAIQPEFLKFGTALAKLPGWQAFEKDMPEPVQFAAPRTAEAAPEPSDTDDVVLPKEGQIPVPSPRPAS